MNFEGREKKEKGKAHHSSAARVPLHTKTTIVCKSPRAEWMSHGVRFGLCLSTLSELHFAIEEKWDVHAYTWSSDVSIARPEKEKSDQSAIGLSPRTRKTTHHSRTNAHLFAQHGQQKKTITARRKRYVCCNDSFILLKTIEPSKRTEVKGERRDNKICSSGSLCATKERFLYPLNYSLATCSILLANT